MTKEKLLKTSNFHFATMFSAFFSNYTYKYRDFPYFWVDIFKVVCCKFAVCGARVNSLDTKTLITLLNHMLWLLKRIISRRQTFLTTYYIGGLVVKWEFKNLKYEPYLEVCSLIKDFLEETNNCVAFIENRLTFGITSLLSVRHYGW